MIVGSLLLILVAIVLAVLGVVQGSDPLLVGSILASLLTAVTLAVSARQAAAARLVAGQDGFVVPFVPVRRDSGSPDVDDVVDVAAPADEPAAEARTGQVYDGRDPQVDEAEADTGPEPATSDATAEEEPLPPPIRTIPTQDGPEERDNQRLVPAQRDAGLDDAGLDDAPPTPGGRFAGADAAFGAADTAETPTQVELDLRPDADSFGAGSAVDIDDLGTSGIGAGDFGPDEDPLDEPPAQLVPPADAALIAELDTNVMVVDGRPRYHLLSCVHLLGREVEALPVSEAIELGFTPCSLCEPDTPLLAQARRS